MEVWVWISGVKISILHIQSYWLIISLTILFFLIRRWAIEFESNNVLVMTAQIFVDILNHAYFSVHQVNLLIFDECHAAVKDAPMKQVLAKLDKCESKFFL